MSRKITIVIEDICSSIATNTHDINVNATEILLKSKITPKEYGVIFNSLEELNNYLSQIHS